MHVSVLLFAALAEQMGMRQLELELPAGSTAGAVWQQLRRGRPEWGEIGKTVVLAVNGEFQQPETPLREGDRVALLPPMSGGAPEFCYHTALVRGALPPAPEWSDSGIGAVVRFEGVTRDHTAGAPGRRVLRLEYEAYEDMAAKRLAAIAQAANERWQLRGMEIVHRLGVVPLGEASVRVVAVAAHRSAAFEGCRFAIDTLKRSAPIWKKEFFSDGSAWTEGEFPGPEVSAPAAPRGDSPVRQDD
ncbi:MAG: molybdopterin converting factor subunit 1 [Terriglobales bacterium]